MSREPLNRGGRMQEKQKKKHLQIFFPLIAATFFISENDTLRPDHLEKKMTNTIGGHSLGPTVRRDNRTEANDTHCPVR